jgi:alpha-beta hydrolase superfamily lysophospholipase
MIRYPVSGGCGRRRTGLLAAGVAAAVAALVLALLVLISGCAPRTEEEAVLAGIGTPRAAAEPAPAPRISQRRFVAADGAVLPLEVWLPPGLVPDNIRAVILALHGFNDYGNAFAIPAAVWARYGIATYAYDQRGFGRAPERGRWPGRFPLAQDAATAARVLRKMYPGKPLYLLGESMGGAVAIVAASGETGAPRPDVDGVILSAPAVWGRRALELLPRVALWAGVRLLPELTLTGRGLGIIASDNLPMLRALSRDPLVIKATRIDTIYGLVDLMDAALASAPRLDVPLLLLYGAHDQLVPPDPMRIFVGELPPDPVHPRRLAYYPHGYHMLLRDLDGATVARDVAAWILYRATPLPSHDDAIEHQRPWPPEDASNR